MDLLITKHNKKYEELYIVYSEFNSISYTMVSININNESLTIELNMI